MPTTFEDGPAHGQRLLLKRAPRFLRVVCDGIKWDALDQLEDEPARCEKIYVYEVHGEVGRCHLYFGGSRGGWYVIATYKLCPEQPTDAEARDSKTRWPRWCYDTLARRKEAA